MTLCIDLVPTEICKWDCNYCVFPNIQNPLETTKEIIDRHCSYIRYHIHKLKSNNIDVRLYMQGGEVGELPKPTIKHLLNTINNKITISTNGLFMEKEYHKDPEIRKYIKQIYWHVNPDCELDDIKDFSDYIKIVRGVVHQDEDKMDLFIAYTDLNIEYSEVENNLSDKSRVSEDIINKCRTLHNDITIDLVNEKICLCIRNFKSITIPLTEENLILALKSFPKDVYDLPDIKDSSCYSCCRLCINRTNNKVIKNKIKLMRLYK